MLSKDTLDKIVTVAIQNTDALIDILGNAPEIAPDDKNTLISELRHFKTALKDQATGSELKAESEHGTPVCDRDTVYDAIDSERDYQDARKGNARRHDDRPMSVGEFIACMETYLTKARDAWARAGGVSRSLHEIRKVAALAVHCMEQHGAPMRE